MSFLQSNSNMSEYRWIYVSVFLCLSTCFKNRTELCFIWLILKMKLWAYYESHPKSCLQTFSAYDVVAAIANIEFSCLNLELKYEIIWHVCVVIHFRRGNLKQIVSNRASKEKKIRRKKMEAAAGTQTSLGEWWSSDLLDDRIFA